LRHHRRCQHAGARQAQEQIGPADHIGQRRGHGALGKCLFLRGHLGGAALVDQPVQITQPDILAPDTQFYQHFQTGNPGRPAAGRHHLDLVERLARHMQRIGRRRADNDGGAVLVVVENRDVHPLAA